MTDETAIELITIQVEHNEKMLKLDNIGVHLDFLGIDLMNAVLDSFGFPKETIRDFEANNFKDEDDELIEIYCRDWLTEPIYKMKSTEDHGNGNATGSQSTGSEKQAGRANHQRSEGQYDQAKDCNSR